MQRKPAATLAVSAAGLLAWLAFEGFSPKPYIPVPGDRPTIGHGSTFYADGRPVKLTDAAIGRFAARELAWGELESKYAKCVRKSLGMVPVTQGEFDAAADFAGQYGCAAWEASSMLRETLAGQYSTACLSYRKYKYISATTRLGDGWFQQGSRWRYDCSTPGNTVCRGVWERQLKRIDTCYA